MRSLIRPALFIVAIPGLIISVAAWGHGRWYDVWFYPPIEQLTLVKLNRLGWTVDCKFDSLPVVSNAEILFEIPGFAVNRAKSWVEIRISHWLLISSFTALCLALQFVEHKRRVELPPRPAEQGKSESEV